MNTSNSMTQTRDINSKMERHPVGSRSYDTLSARSENVTDFFRMFDVSHCISWSRHDALSCRYETRDDVNAKKKSDTRTDIWTRWNATRKIQTTYTSNVSSHDIILFSRISFLSHVVFRYTILFTIRDWKRTHNIGSDVILPACRIRLKYTLSLTFWHWTLHSNIYIYIYIYIYIVTSVILQD